MMKRDWFLAALAALLSWVAVPDGSRADDRHAGYYYPHPASTEIYDSQAKELPGVTRNTRIGFVTGLAAQQSERPYPSQTAIFAKGSDAEKLIIVSLTEGRLNSIYRARAVLALLTASARTTEIFQKFQVETVFTFIDLCKMLGFKQLTISDGVTFAHQFKIQ
jgi:hypothetical protein